MHGNMFEWTADLYAVFLSLVQIRFVTLQVPIAPDAGVTGATVNCDGYIVSSTARRHIVIAG